MKRNTENMVFGIWWTILKNKFLVNSSLFIIIIILNTKLLMDVDYAICTNIDNVLITYSLQHRGL